MLNLNQVTVSVTHIEKAFDFYKQLGLLPIVKSPHYARFIVPGNEATFSIHLADEVRSTTIVYFEVEDLGALVSDLQRKGFVFSQTPKDQSWGWREAYLSDPDGNQICLYHAGSVRLNPDWRIPESKGQHLLTEVHFEAWLHAYKRAWEAQLPKEAAALFADDAVYYETPFSPPAVGNAEILKYWQEVPEQQAQNTFHFQIIKVYDNVGFCKWQANFIRKHNQQKVRLDGIFEVHFNETGRCHIFKEWWHRLED